MILYWSIIDAAEAASISPRSLAKQLNMGNAASLERKIKRELELEGKWDPSQYQMKVYSQINCFPHNIFGLIYKVQGKIQ